MTRTRSTATKLIKKVRVRKSRLHYLGVFADEDISKGETILHFGGRISSTRTRYSLQIDENKHLSRSGSVDDRLNHSCDPNCHIDFDKLELKALRDISAGEELTYHYCTAEYELRFPFRCRCGSSKCVGVVRCFKYLDGSAKSEIFRFLSPFLKRRSAEEMK